MTTRETVLLFVTLMAIGALTECSGKKSACPIRLPPVEQPEADGVR